MKLPLLAPLLLSGCAVLSSPPGTQLSDTWIKVTDPLPMKWEIVSESEKNQRCASVGNGNPLACAIRLTNNGHGYCLVLSTFSEQEAKSYWIRSITGSVRTLDNQAETLWRHEKKHCDGYNHEVKK